MKWLLLIATCALASAQSFEVATVKPAAPDQAGYGSRTTRNTLVLWNNDLRHIILYAWQLQEYQLSGGPKWASADTFDVTGKFDASTASLPPGERIDRVRAMLRTLLADRFQLVLRTEKKAVPGYALIVAKGGFLLQPVTPSGGISSGPALLKADGATLAQFAQLLSAHLGRPVVDQTRIAGAYTFLLRFAPENAPPENTAPSLFTAIAEQCGLKLERREALADTYVIERAERPSAN